MFSIGSNEIGSLIALIIYLVVIISTSKLNIKENFRQLLLWIGIVAALCLGYSYYNRLSLKHFFLPATASVEKNGEDYSLEIIRANDGHFYLETEINGKSIVFLVDTGATSMSLTKADAIKAGIDVPKLKYTIPVTTANGNSYAAPSSLESVKIGEIEFEDVYITVSSSNADMSLMGVGFLKRFKSYAVEGDKMTLVYK